jgi:hypothetical protein
MIGPETRHSATLTGQQPSVDPGEDGRRHQPGIAITNRLHHLDSGVHITERRHLMPDSSELPVLDAKVFSKISVEQARRPESS